MHDNPRKRAFDRPSGMEVPRTEDTYNHSSFKDVRPSSYGYAEPDRERKSRRKKRPLGFVAPEPPAKPRRRAGKPAGEKES